MSTLSEALPMPSAYFLLILREYGRTAHHRAALLDGTDVREGRLAESAAPITLGQQLRQIRNANRLLEPGWALSMGARLHAGTHGPVGFGAITAPTVRQSLDVMTRFGQVRSPHFRLRASVQGDEVRLVPEDRVALADEERTVLLELVMLSTQGLVESILGRQMEGGRFEFPDPAPAYAWRHEHYFHAPVHFACREPAIVIPAAWLQVECPLADPAMFDASLRSLTIGDPARDPGAVLVARVEQLIAGSAAPPGIEGVARQLRVSRRTLTRQLRHAGTSFRRLREASQKGHAASLLRDRRLDVAEVAYALGYEDPANFGRACRRWFGMPPGEYRSRVLDGH